MSDERKEIQCNVCKKVRMLSKREAEEDGWALTTDQGLVCDKCLPKYGIPAGPFMRNPTKTGLCKLNGETGIEIIF